MRWVYLILIGGICFSAPLEAKGLKPWSSTQVKVIDGDSIVVGGREVRLEGIDAPEYHQDCYNAEGKAYACGVRAMEYMQNLTKDQKLRCEPIEIDRYKRVVAVCFAGKTNLNAEMVRSGNAVAYDRYDDTYVKDEQDAREHKRGIWSGKFMRPEFWRLLHK